MSKATTLVGQIKTKKISAKALIGDAMIYGRQPEWTAISLSAAMAIAEYMGKKRTCNATQEDGSVVKLVEKGEGVIIRRSSKQFDCARLLAGAGG